MAGEKDLTEQGKQIPFQGGGFEREAWVAPLAGWDREAERSEAILGLGSRAGGSGGS